ncbi:M23 family metallopeptidase [Terrarubrum flagellatum]|uniref:M23 family metallopeptidase n=1 Tax=Terrirubrum flagellatum TaxID=2895980 RepID=UPI003144F9A7
MSLHQRSLRRAPAPIDPPGTVRIRRRALYAATAMLAFTSVWSVGVTAFVFFRDDLSARLIARQVENQYAYEERITALKSHVDRLASRQMIDQDSVEARVAELMSRQSQLETRSAMVAMLAQSVGSDGGTTQARKTMPESPLLTAGAPDARQPVTPPTVTSFAPLTPRPLPVFDEPLRGGDGLRPSNDAVKPDANEPLKQRVSSLGRSLSTMEKQQLSALDQIESQSRGKVQRLRSVMAEAGVDPDRVAPSPAAATSNPMGGPLVPLSASDAQNFDVALLRARQIVQTAQRLTKASRFLPLRHPLGHPADVTSPFGVRNDPFLRGYAMHTGIDFRGDYGSPARATGAGVVTKAEYTGGYGNMVEVDHGNGLATRYAHLSAILVSEGQKVDAGAVVGRVGSTGRSTGNHLHYEVRVTGDATDPNKFLKIGGRNRDLL